MNSNIAGNDSMKVFRRQNMMQGHIIRRPKKSDLNYFDTSEEVDQKNLSINQSGEVGKASFRSDNSNKESHKQMRQSTATQPLKDIKVDTAIIRSACLGNYF